MIGVQNDISTNSNYYDNSVLEKNVVEQSTDKGKDIHTDELAIETSRSVDPDASSCYDKSLFQPEHRDELLAKMMNSMSRAENHEKIYKLEDMAYCNEVYAFSFSDGKIHVSGGEGYEHKAAAYERLVNASLNRSWSTLFGGGMVSENDLINTVDGMLKYYTGIDHEIIKNNKNDSIVNHVNDAFQRWCEEHPISTVRFDSRI